MSVAQKISNENSTIFWQEWVEYSAGEPAILIENYTDCVTLTQEGRHVNINQHELAAFIKVLQQIAKDKTKP